MITPQDLRFQPNIIETEKKLPNTLTISWVSVSNPLQWFLKIQFKDPLLNPQKHYNHNSKTKRKL